MADSSAGRAAIWNPKLARLIVYGTFTGAPTLHSFATGPAALGSKAGSILGGTQHAVWLAAPPIRVGTTDVP